MSFQLTKGQENINTLPFIPSHQGRGDIRVVPSLRLRRMGEGLSCGVSYTPQDEGEG